MADMVVNVRGTRQLAERACRMVFGENADAGPVCPTPPPLLKLLEDWPQPSDVAHKVALELPMDFDIAKEMAKDHRKAVAIVACRITILHNGRKVGYAIRTDRPGINAIQLWQETWALFNRKIRQAH